MTFKKRGRRNYKRLKFCVDREIVEITISQSTQDFLNLSTEDIPYIISEYLQIEEKYVVNALEDLVEKTGYNFSWFVEYILLRFHYKDLYESNNQFLHQFYPIKSN